VNARVDTVIHGGRIVTPLEVFDGAIAIRGERIVALGPADCLPPADRYLDASGKIVLPGPIDCHIHVGPEYDDWPRASIAAAHAGLTTLLAFSVPDDERRESLPHAIERVRSEAAPHSVLDFGLHFILGNQPYVLESIPAAIEAGVTSFKFFMTYKKRPNRMCSDDFLCRAMAVIGRHGGVAQVHAENGDVLYYLEEKAIAEGRVHPRDFPATCPEWTEEEAINRAIKIAGFTGCPVYVVHLSTRLGLERIKAAQGTGQRVWTETCPQYLLLTDAEMERWGPLAKIGPPLRPAGGPDRDALWAGSSQGYIATVGSDHAPRPRAVKEPGWQNIFVDGTGRSIPFGAPSVETMVPLLYSQGVVDRGLPLTWLARVLAENPARIFGLSPRKGSIRVGADADFLLIDPDADWTISVADHHGRAGWTLYEGWKVRGRPWMSLLRGQVLLNQGRIEQPAGYGRYLHRGAPVPPIA
jgi:dihydropyrimidinase